MRLTTLFMTAFPFLGGGYAESQRDPKTGLNLQTYNGYKGGITFRYGIPKEPDTIVGQIVVPKNTGYASISLGGGMKDTLMLVAWNNRGRIVHSLRYSATYDLPRMYNNRGTSVRVLPCGTGVDNQNWYITFVCSGCMSWNGKRVFDQNSNVKIGWATSPQQPLNPANPGSAFAMHQRTGKFTANLRKAKMSSSVAQTCR